MPLRAAGCNVPNCAYCLSVERDFVKLYMHKQFCFGGRGVKRGGTCTAN